MTASPAPSPPPAPFHCVRQTPYGWLALLGTEHSLQRVSLQPELPAALAGLGLPGSTHAPDANAIPGDSADAVAPDAAAPGAVAVDAAPGPLSAIIAAFDAYFAGDFRALDAIPLDFAGAPPFHAAAWTACRQIPPGETRSYRWLAAAAGSPQASRAAGQAMARNPWPLVVPCHRVIGSAGKLHGYGAGGLTVKARLLEMERRQTPIL